MKNLNLVFILILGILILFSSCQKENEQITQQSNAIEDNLKTAPGVSGYVYYVTYEEWGRAARDCNGWGLCEFSDCWFCCADDETGEIVDCETGQLINNASTVYIDEKTGTGYMFIKLDPDFSQQKEAINNQLPFYIDEDIVGEKFTLLKGEYLFNAEIGYYGGYTISVSQY
jgi:hypothetical protein